MPNPPGEVKRWAPAIKLTTEFGSSAGATMKPEVRGAWLALSDLPAIKSAAVERERERWEEQFWGALEAAGWSDGEEIPTYAIRDAFNQEDSDA